MDESRSRARAPRRSLDDLIALHAEVTRQTRALEKRHRDRLKCGPGCSGCCIDGLTVFEVEAERIRVHCGALLATDAPHPVGACAFLDQEGHCRIYEHRPYVCRTQGLPLRWLEEHDGQAVECRDICPLNEEGPPVDELSREHCWLLGPVEGRLAAIQRRFGDGRLRRVALRDLFARD